MTYPTIALRILAIIDYDASNDCYYLSVGLGKFAVLLQDILGSYVREFTRT